MKIKTKFLQKITSYSTIPKVLTSLVLSLRVYLQIQKLCVLKALGQHCLRCYLRT